VKKTEAAPYPLAQPRWHNNSRLSLHYSPWLGS